MVDSINGLHQRDRIAESENAFLLLISGESVGRIQTERHASGTSLVGDEVKGTALSGRRTLSSVILFHRCRHPGCGQLS